jgi:hypothetical protein
LPAPPPLRTGRAPFRCIRLKHEPTHLSRHAVNLMGLEATCTLPRQSQLPKCSGGGSRTSKDPYGPADISAWLPNAGWLSSHVRPHQREVCPLSGGVMFQPLSGPLQVGLRLLPLPVPAVLSGHLTTSLAVEKQQDNGLTTFRKWNNRWFRSCLYAGGAASACAEFGPAHLDHLPFWPKPVSIFGLACVTTLTALHLG